MEMKTHDEQRFIGSLRDASLLETVRELLEQGDHRQAAAVSREPSLTSAVMRNAHGVAMLRNGQYAAAVEWYRAFCLNEGGVMVREGLPPVYAVNYATALMLTGNLAGAERLLREVGGNHPAADRLRKAIADWKRTLSGWEWFWYTLYGVVPDRGITLSYPPGELDDAPR